MDQVVRNTIFISEQRIRRKNCLLESTSNFILNSIKTGDKKCVRDHGVRVQVFEEYPYIKLYFVSSRPTFDHQEPVFDQGFI